MDQENEVEEEGEEKEEKEEKEAGQARQAGCSHNRPRRPRLTQRDVDALRWIVQQRAVNSAQVQQLLTQLSGAPVGDRRCRQVAARWEQLGLVTRQHVWHTEPAVIIPTVQAAKMCGLERWRPPAIGTLRHTLTAAQVRLQAVPIGSARTWLAESQLRRDAPPNEHIADGAWFEADGRSVAVEVELSPHGKKRVHAAIKSLLAAHRGGVPQWTQVLYLCSPATIRQVETARDELAPAERARVFVRVVPSLPSLPSQRGQQ